MCNSIGWVATVHDMGSKTVQESAVKDTVMAGNRLSFAGMGLEPEVVVSSWPNEASVNYLSLLHMDIDMNRTYFYLHPPSE